MSARGWTFLQRRNGRMYRAWVFEFEYFQPRPLVTWRTRWAFGVWFNFGPLRWLMIGAGPFQFRIGGRFNE